jgi:hypothetical protein
MKVPWLSRDKIGKKAENLIKNSESMLGYPLEPPIPVEDIIERYLGLRLAYDDLEKALGMKDVLGATWVKSRLICVNEKLFERSSEGRVVFTCAHEVGHWILHRKHIGLQARISAEAGAVICRAANAREPIEWQADYFAACLLMPEEKVRSAFCQTLGTEQLVLENVKSAFWGTSVCVDPCVENWHFIAAMVCEAGGFTNCSKQAMIIRLQELGLLVNPTGAPMAWRRSPAMG